MKANVCLVVLLLLIILPSCAPIRAQNEGDIKDLLLVRTDFPQGTIINDPSSPVDGYPAESADISASLNYDGLFQIVARYSSVKRAEREFTKDLGYFREDSFGNPWITPIEISYESPVATNYHVACGDLSQGYQCRMIGQYDECYVLFFAYISDQGISLQKFQDVVMKLDDRMAQCSEEN